MRLKPTKSTIAFLGIALAAILVVGGAALWLLQGRLRDESAVLQARQQELEDGQRIARRQHEARTALDSDRALIANLEPYVSQPAYVPTLLRQLELLALATENRVMGVRPAQQQQQASRIQERRDPNAQAGSAQGGHAHPDGAAEEGAEGEGAEAGPPTPYTPLSIEVNLLGRYQGIQRFVEALTRFPKIIAVDQMQIRPESQAENRARGLLDVQLKVTAFIMKDESPAAPAPASVASARVVGEVN